jgi:hypothetical protein
MWAEKEEFGEDLGPIQEELKVPLGCAFSSSYLITSISQLSRKLTV